MAHEWSTGNLAILIRRLVALTCVSLMAGCSGSTEEATPTTEATAADPYAVPAVIDAEYLNRVMAKLAEVKVVAVRDTVNSGTLTPEAQRRLEAIYSGPALESQLRQARGPLPADLPKIDESTPPDRFTVTEIKQATPTCVWFDADIVNGVGGDAGRNTLVIKTSPSDSRYNPTPWRQHVSRLESDLEKGELCEE